MRIFVAILASFFTTAALAEGAPPIFCSLAKPIKDEMKAKHGTWVVLTKEQFEFVRGIFVMHPLTPLELPYGDSAVLTHMPGDADSLIFFIDGAMACAPMVATPEVVDLLNSVGRGDVTHGGKGL